MCADGQQVVVGQAPVRVEWRRERDGLVAIDAQSISGEPTSGVKSVKLREATDEHRVAGGICPVSVVMPDAGVDQVVAQG